MICRSCGCEDTSPFVDLGRTPLANAYLDSPAAAEPTYPLAVLRCEGCQLLQLTEFVDPSVLFADYAYLSSYSDSWVAHARRFAVDAIKRFGLTPQSLVMEVASNDGYLLRHFDSRGIPVIGVEPARNVAEVARSRGIPTVCDFFGPDAVARLHREYKLPDLVVANNVLAHVPDTNGFVQALADVVAPDGVISIEFPHALTLVERVQFDTIYHEHCYYFSLLTLEPLLNRHTLRVFDVELLPTHGGSLRISACSDTAPWVETKQVELVRQLERSHRLDSPSGYADFAPRVERCRQGFLAFLADARRRQKSVAAYGAAAKGTTFLNVCGVGADDIAYVADRSAEKQGRWLPGSHLPIVPPSRLRQTRPDYVVILPWNIATEIVDQTRWITSWGGAFVTAVPDLVVFPAAALTGPVEAPPP